MARVTDTRELDSNDLWEISHAAARLTEYGCSVSARHLKDNWTRMQFNRELAYYGRRVVEDVQQRRLSLEEGLGEIERERQSLVSQSLSAASKWLGLAGGTGQMFTGAAVCVGSAGTLCLPVGVPMMAHGANNVYENGRNLYEGRSDVQGPLKKGYQAAAKALGYTKREGTIAYLAGDLALSGYGMLRKVLRADAWRLFRYMDTDKERAIMQMSRTSLVLEVWNDKESLRQIVDESKR